jgi:CHRD domain-containing protein
MKVLLRAALVVFTLFLSVANAKDKDQQFATRLSSYNEVHFDGGPPATLRGAISSAARGAFKATLNKSTNEIHYELSYQGLESDVTQAHIHFGQRHTVGGIVVWLCETPGTPAPAAVAAVTPDCPGPREGAVSGTITAAQVLAQTAQGINTGEFEELVRALRAGAGYANVHTATFRPGEIRGQIKVVSRKNDDDDDDDEDED